MLHYLVLLLQRANFSGIMVTNDEGVVGVWIIRISPGVVSKMHIMHNHHVLYYQHLSLRQWPVKLKLSKIVLHVVIRCEKRDVIALRRGTVGPRDHICMLHVNRLRWRLAACCGRIIILSKRYFQHHRPTA